MWITFFVKEAHSVNMSGNEKHSKMLIFSNENLVSLILANASKHLIDSFSKWLRPSDMWDASAYCEKMRNTCRLLIPLRHTTYCRYLKIKQWLGLNSQNVNTSYWSRPCCISLHSDSAKIVAQTNTNGSSKRRLVLGIETSCDDTGAAVVDDRGIVVGDALNSQTKTHVA